MRLYVSLPLCTISSTVQSLTDNDEKVMLGPGIFSFMKRFCSLMTSIIIELPDLKVYLYGEALSFIQCASLAKGFTTVF